MHFWYYNGTTPTKNLATFMNLTTLNTRKWWLLPHDSAVLKDNAAWCPPFWSVTPGEGKLLTVSYAFPEDQYNRSSSSVRACVLFVLMKVVSNIHERLQN